MITRSQTKKLLEETKVDELNIVMIKEPECGEHINDKITFKSLVGVNVTLGHHRKYVLPKTIFDDMIDPISLTYPKQAVTIEGDISQQIYDKKNIIEWLKTSDTYPTTNKKIMSKTIKLIPHKHITMLLFLSELDDTNDDTTTITLRLPYIHNRIMQYYINAYCCDQSQMKVFVEGEIKNNSWNKTETLRLKYNNISELDGYNLDISTIFNYESALQNMKLKLFGTDNLYGVDASTWQIDGFTVIYGKCPPNPEPEPNLESKTEEETIPPQQKYSYYGYPHSVVDFAKISSEKNGGYGHNPMLALKVPCLKQLLDFFKENSIEFSEQKNDTNIQYNYTWFSAIDKIFSKPNISVLDDELETQTLIQRTNKYIDYINSDVYINGHVINSDEIEQFEHRTINVNHSFKSHDDYEIIDYGEIHAQCIYGTSFKNCTIKGKFIKECTFLNCTFTNCTFDKMHFCNTSHFIKCNLWGNRFVEIECGGAGHIDRTIKQEDHQNNSNYPYSIYVVGNKEFQG
jgi:hypothetical protein